MFRVFLNGKEVKILLRMRGISQYMLARKANLNRVYICRLINMEAPIGLNAQKKIQSTLRGVPWERLFSVVENPKEKANV